MALITFLCSYAFLCLSAVAEPSNFICIAGVKSEKFFSFFLLKMISSIFFLRLFHSIHPSICLIYLHSRQFMAPLNILWLHISLQLALFLPVSLCCMSSLSARCHRLLRLVFLLFFCCLCLLRNLLLPYTNVATMESSSLSSS